MPAPQTASEDAAAPDVKRIAFDLPVEDWNELQRDAAELSIAEGRSIAVAEVARRRVIAGARAKVES